ncbi:SH3 domain-containing protein [Streptomyces sp. G45]|uniref:SH3 domain-containing protein n=1 Tax=Streptomyces sp. G45 TaxID=3406627 RepID=UPI003C1F1CA1
MVPAIAAVAVAVPLSLASPAAAHASCGKTASDKDGGSWNRTANGANERSGSSTGCAITGIAYNSHRLDYHCYTSGNDGKTWTYLRNDSTGVSGWVRDDLLSDGGSLYSCGF